MHSLRKWFYKPKKEDSSKLAMFYWADEELTMVATELDSFDGRTDPERCSLLVSQLRVCQDKVLSICNEIMDEAIPDLRANRDFRAKFPDDVLHENLAGQLWFGAECLAAGSNIMNRELESAGMRPLAKALTRALDNVRCLLREQSLRNSLVYSDKVKEALRIFDRLFAEFELCYVTAMVPIKSAKEYHLQQEIVVLFSETLIRALKIGLVTQEMVDHYDPSLMFTIPRLAIVWGLLLFPEGPFNVDRDSADTSELFRPFCSLLSKIRDLLWTLSRSELVVLEKMLCSQEEPQIDDKNDDCSGSPVNISEDYILKFYQNHSNCKKFIQDFYAYNFGISSQNSENQDVSNGVQYSSDTAVNKKVVNTFQNCESHCSNTAKFTETNDGNSMPDVELLACSPALQHSNEDSDFNQSSSISERSISQGELNAVCDDGILCENEHRTNLLSSEKSLEDSSQIQSSVLLAKCDSSTETCLSADSDEQGMPSIAQNDLCIGCSLSAHCNTCSSSGNASSSEHLTPSRELIRQVMSRVEIVPPGQHIAGYSSSPESSPRAFHHGLLSHSFPTHPVYSAPVLPEIPHHVRASKVCGSKRRMLQRQTLHYYSLQLNCDISPPSHSQNFTSSSGLINSSHQDPLRFSSTPLAIPQVQQLRAESSTISENAYSSCSSCQTVSSVSTPDWDSTSPETSSYNSECQDDEEIALALQAAEIASRNKARSRFKNSSDLLHKLFVCISGVADQLQTNYASDFRNILKSVFDINCSPNVQVSCRSGQQRNELPLRDECGHSGDSHGELISSDRRPASGEESAPFQEMQSPVSVEVTTTPINSDETNDEDERDHSSIDSAEEAVPDGSPTPSLVLSDVRQNNQNFISDGFIQVDPPAWIPDESSSHCMSCKVPFTLLRRRHHCRNCGKIFCSRCSSNSIPLPRFGHLKPVRVCNQCFMYQLTSLVMQQQL